MNAHRFAYFFIGFYILVIFTALFRFGILSRVRYSYMDSEFPFWMQQKDYVHTKGENQEILFLGDSKMKAGVIPSQFCENAYNLAVGGGTSLEMYYSLKDYMEYHPKPAKIFIGFGGLHYQYEDCFKSRNHYFHFLLLKKEFETQIASYKLNQLTFKQLQNELIDSTKYFLLFPQKYSAACINSKFGRGDFNHTAYKKTAESRGQMFFGMAEQAGGLGFEAYASLEICPRIDYYLHKIIALCNENQIPVYIVQPPINDNTWEKLTENGHYPAFQSYLKNLAKETHIQVEWDIPHYPPEFFGDTAHLNARGAERFTAELKEKYHH